MEEKCTLAEKLHDKEIKHGEEFKASNQEKTDLSQITFKSNVNLIQFSSQAEEKNRIFSHLKSVHVSKMRAVKNRCFHMP